MTWAEWMEKIGRVVKGFIMIKNQLTESGKVNVNFLTINIGNRNIYPKLPDDFDVQSLRKIDTSELKKVVEEVLTECIKTLEPSLNPLPEEEQYQEMTNAATKTIEIFLEDRVKVGDDLQIDIYPDPSLDKEVK